MAYASGNPKTKKELKERFMAGRTVEVYQPNSDLTGASIPLNGKVYISGPHYPQPHKWYAEGIMKDGKLVSVK